MKLRTRTLTLSATAVLALSACSSAANDGSDADAQLVVSAAFYPLEYAAQQVAGDAAEIRAVTSPGVEPHDLELSPAAVREMREADVLLYLEGFQPAVDDAVAFLGEDVTVINVADHIDLREAEEHAHEDEDDGGEDEHADEGDALVEEDPHFWLDPEIFAQLAPVLAEAFGDADSANAEGYADRATTLEDDLLVLDEEFSTSLARCERDVIVISHEAFGYLTDAYGLEQVGLAGLTPDAEPSPSRIREVREIAEHEGITTVFFETLVDSSVSESFASDLNLDTAVLDPIEGVTGDDDYRSVMDRNREALVEGLDCR